MVPKDAEHISRRLKKNIKSIEKRKTHEKENNHSPGTPVIDSQSRSASRFLTSVVERSLVKNFKEDDTIISRVTQAARRKSQVIRRTLKDLTRKWSGRNISQASLPAT